MFVRRFLATIMPIPNYFGPESRASFSDHACLVLYPKLANEIHLCGSWNAAPEECRHWRRLTLTFGPLSEMS
ncbi:MAG: hypothetical protein CM15mP74_12290 [Halieaceae bacterium]|nr:MAG: hypothetical protein CM15mP74_12290 [Halieaceae bacterium]